MKAIIRNSDTLVAVSAYAGDVKQVLTNMPFYRHHQCPVLILSPTDAPITLGTLFDGVTCQSAGKKGWIGQHTLERHRLFLEILSHQPYNFFLFNDSDSLCLSEQIPHYLYENPMHVWSNEVTDTNPSPSLLPKIAMQPPYFLSRTVVESLLAHYRNLATSYTAPSPEGWPMPIPTDCIDHYMLQLTYGAHLSHQNFRDGASFETNSEHGLSVMAEHVSRFGKVMIHSIKTPEALAAVVKARRRLLARG
jgi:hypothetical protein